MTKENLRIALQKRALIEAGCGAECSWCHEIIYPGEHFYAAPHTQYPFCSAECFANWNGARLVAPADPDYASWFRIKESENEP